MLKKMVNNFIILSKYMPEWVFLLNVKSEGEKFLWFKDSFLQLKVSNSSST